jgi:hypothetical protein
MKKSLWFLLVWMVTFFGTGCYTVSYNSEAVVQLSEGAAANTRNLVQLSVGMSKQEAVRLMGTKDVYNDRSQGLHVSNPISTQTLKSKDNQTLEVLTYLTGPLTQVQAHEEYKKYKADPEKYDESKTDKKRWEHVLTEEQAKYYTPLVFKDDKLIGWGFWFLKDISGD